ncbi:MAG: response regulator [Desulfuromonas sp.]|nr:MAG: response regulator [Desulfuromonas sp.]
MHEKISYRIVIAEDEYLIAADVEEAASQAGYDVVGIAPDGKRALELIDEHSPDIAILDIQMPHMNGLEAARQIRDRFAIPTIIMTAYESPDVLAEAKEAGIGAYLVKPPTAAKLQRSVEVAMARHEDMMALRETNTKLQKALEEIRTLRDILPICCFCKKIRDDEGYWNQVETYISKHTGTRFTHGICPECMDKHYKLEPPGKASPDKE